MIDRATTPDPVSAVADVLGVRRCRYLSGGFHFDLGAGWTITVQPESAGRLRIEGCQDGRVRERMWSKADDLDRLSEVVQEIAKLRLAAHGTPPTRAIQP